VVAVGAGARTFLVGLAGVLVGVLIGSSWRDDAPSVVRADPGRVDLERRVERVEATVRTMNVEEPTPEHPAVPPTREAWEVVDPGAPDSLYAQARQEASREQVEQLASELARAFAGAGGAYGEVYRDVRERFLFRSYADVLRDLGRPVSVTRDPAGPTFQYRFEVPGGEYDATLHLGFADGHVFEVFIGTARLSGPR